MYSAFSFLRQNGERNQFSTCTASLKKVPPNQPADSIKKLLTVMKSWSISKDSNVQIRLTNHNNPAAY